MNFTTKQLLRIDDVYAATLEYCRFLADIPGMEYDISVLGPVAEAAAEIMRDHGVSVLFPYEDANGLVHDYY